MQAPSSVVSGRNLLWILSGLADASSGSGVVPDEGRIGTRTVSAQIGPYMERSDIRGEVWEQS
jgi:hypothetical protein